MLCTLGTGHRRIKLELSCTAIPKEMKKRVAYKTTLGRSTPADIGLTGPFLTLFSPTWESRATGSNSQPWLLHVEAGIAASSMVAHISQPALKMVPIPVHHGEWSRYVLCRYGASDFSPHIYLLTADSDQLLDLLCPWCILDGGHDNESNPRESLRLRWTAWEFSVSASWDSAGLRLWVTLTAASLLNGYGLFFLVLFCNNTVNSKRYLHCILYCKLRYMGRYTYACCEHCYFMDWEVARWVKLKLKELSSDNQTHIKNWE